MGIKKTYEYDRIKSHYFWPVLTKDTREFFKTCPTCQKNVSKSRIPPASLGTMSIIVTPFEQIAIDLIGPIYPASHDRHIYIYTGHPGAISIKNVTITTVSEALLNIFSRLGVPQKIIS